jgi:FAD/FMN-containing dehydrogenase
MRLKVDNAKFQVKVEAGVIIEKLNKILYDNNMAFSV